MFGDGWRQEWRRLQCSGRRDRRAKNVGSKGKSALELVDGCGEGADGWRPWLLVLRELYVQC
jgi:hypothetical protein